MARFLKNIVCSLFHWRCYDMTRPVGLHQMEWCCDKCGLVWVEQDP